MAVIKEKPESEFCYEIHIFGESRQCPDLDDTVVNEPKCKKYGIVLPWNRSGTVLKCEECLSS